MKKKVAILGSTGSIGKSLLKIVQKDKRKFNILLLTADKNYKIILDQANNFKVKNIIITNDKYYKLAISKNKNRKINIYKNFDNLKKILKNFSNDDINIALFVDPVKDQLIATHELGIKTIEFHTGRYANAFTQKTNVEVELKKIIENTDFASKLGLNCHAGHGLTYENVSPIVSIKNIVELNIGHFIIANSIFDGLESSILKMREIIAKAVK